MDPKVGYDSHRPIAVPVMGTIDNYTVTSIAIAERALPKLCMFYLTY
jgi:hypothetical protein